MAGLPVWKGVVYVSRSVGAGWKKVVNVPRNEFDIQKNQLVLYRDSWKFEEG